MENYSVIGKEILEKEYRPIDDALNKKLLLDMLKYVHAFCEDKGIRYFLYFGTLLGAIRHKGFIPWDDDIDICMTRKEYEKFKKVFPRGKNGRYSLMTSDDPNHYCPFAKIVDNETYLVEIENKPIGLFIDLFIIDNEGQTLRGAKAFLHFVSFFIRIDTIVMLEYDYWPDKKKRLHRFLNSIFGKIPQNKWMCLIDKLSKLKQADRLSNYVGSVNASKYNERQLLKGEWFKESILTDFEDERFWIPGEYDKVLSTIYRNYMEIPPKRSQHSHHAHHQRWIKNSHEC